MTIDEAIKDIKDNIKPVVGGKSLDMAIEALERQLGTNLVSKQAVIDLWDKYHYSIATKAIEYDRALRNLLTADAPDINVGNIDDCISRKAAIDCLNNVSFDCSMDQEVVEEELLKLPPAHPSWNMGHWICESKRSDTLGVTWNTWTCDQCNCVATNGWEHTESGMKPKGKFCSECGSIMSEKVIYVNITEKE